MFHFINFFYSKLHVIYRLLQRLNNGIDSVRKDINDGTWHNTVGFGLKELLCKSFYFNHLCKVSKMMVMSKPFYFNHFVES
jgi:hypothetical protein